MFAAVVAGMRNQVKNDSTSKSRRIDRRNLSIKRASQSKKWSRKTALQNNYEQIVTTSSQAMNTHRASKIRWIPIPHCSGPFIMHSITTKSDSTDLDNGGGSPKATTSRSCKFREIMQVVRRLSATGRYSIPYYLPEVRLYR